MSRRAADLGRGFIESLFSEIVEFFLVTGSVVNPETLDEEVTEEVLYRVPARVKYPSMVVSEKRGAGELVGNQSIIVSVAVGATPNVNSEFFCRVTASTTDSSLIGRVYKVQGFPQSGQVTAHRYPVEEIS